jgi:citrate lyase subunit beta/citryl-CoA lyase
VSGALTYLYVPGDMPARFDKALASGADAVVLDLEDAVALRDKDSARAEVAAWVSTCEPGDVEVWVRVNPGPLQEADIRAVAHARLTGVWLPKVGSPEEIAIADRVLADVCPHAAVSPLLETGAALFDALAIAQGPRVRFLQIGEADLAVDLGIDGESDPSALLFARSQVVAASAAAGLLPPLGAVSRNFRDLDAFTADTQSLSRLGFVGRACIHPAQVPAARAVFEPTPEDVTRARAVLSALESGGAGVDQDGHLIDEAVAKRARRVMERA